MFLSTNKCEGLGECIKECPTEAIRLINNKAFSCITCGICFENCPNHAIFKNKYGGYVVDRAKCNGCGICKFNCPINNITITENGIVKGICSRCGLCAENCSVNSRIDGFEIVKEKQINYLKSLDLAIPSYDINKEAKTKEKSRNCVDTDIDKCILCGRCEYYCPTQAIEVYVDHDEGICTSCRVCSDICPTNAIKKGIIDPLKCSLCLSCIKTCPNNAIILNDFKVNINKLNQKNTGYIVSCLNCGLCVDNTENKSLIMVDGKLRYDPSRDIGDNLELEHKKAIDNCPVSTLRESNDIIIIGNYEEDSEDYSLKGFCISCGKCIQVCDRENARRLNCVTWDGKVSNQCISCGICYEVCPKDAITLKKGSINVNLDKCILCENCGIHCPVDAIPKTTMAKKVISGGFNEIDNELCIECKLCYKICPEDAIIDDKGVMSVDKEKCTYCGACKNVCPSNAFIFEREFKNLI